MKKNVLIKAIAVPMIALGSISCSEKFDPTYLDREISKIKESVQDLTTRLSSLEKTVSTINQDVKELQTIVSALQKNLYIVSVTPKFEGSQVVYYDIVFSDGSVARITNGKDGKDGVNGTNGTNGTNGSDGKDGKDGSTPVIGVTMIDGVYYWTVNGELLLDKDGNKVRATGEQGPAGPQGEQGEPGSGEGGSCGCTAPVIGVTELDGVLYWTVNGEFLLDQNGNKVPATGAQGEQGPAGPQGPQGPQGQPGKDGSDGTGGESLFKSVEVKDGTVTIGLKDGTSFIIPMKLPSMLRLEDNKLHFGFGQAHSTHIVQENIIGMAVTEKPEGWRASVNGCAVRIQAPAETKEDYDRSGFVSVIATSGDQTFIGKIYVTLDRPLFEMSVSPDGRMTLTELDSDFNSPGFLAGFCKAEDFDPKAIAAHADEYHSAADKESFYLSWNSYIDGKTYESSLSSTISEAVPGQKYAAYCLPGSYSKWIGSKASEYDVCVKYFTYSKVNFAANGVGVDKANLSISILGAESFYGGIMMYSSDDELPAIAEEFLSDAAPAIGGSGAGVFGASMKSYSGKISLFAAPLDGDGKPSERTILPGAKYAIGIIPIDGERESGEYSVDDVIIKTVEMNQPAATSTVLVTAKEGAKTTTSASAIFDITSSVSKFFYRVVPESELTKSGMSELQYVLAKGICWDRAIMQASGAINGIDDNCTNLAPGTKCKAIGAGFTTKGEYYLVSITVTSDEVRLSSGDISLDSFSTSVINSNSTEISVKFTASSNMTEIRYIDRLTKQEYEQNYGSEDKVFSTLTSGSRWDYSSVNPSSNSIEMYVSPSDTEFILFAVGMDSDGAYTKLKKIEIKL